MTVVPSAPAGSDPVRLVFRTAGSLHEQLVYRFQEAELSVSAPDTVRAYDVGGRLFRLTAEVRRIQLADLFDPPPAVHLSRVEPLPHQIQLYSEMLPLEAPNDGRFDAKVLCDVSENTAILTFEQHGFE